VQAERHPDSGKCEEKRALRMHAEDQVIDVEHLPPHVQQLERQREDGNEEDYRHGQDAPQLRRTVDSRAPAADAEEARLATFR